MPKQAIIVGARIGFETIHQIAERMQGVDFPIELALPHRYDDWKEAWSQSKEMLGEIEKTGVSVSSVHATQAKLNDEAFIDWGHQTALIAEHFKAKAITVHPNRVSKGKRANLQELAHRQLRQLQRETSVMISVETFTGYDRIFRPDEIIEAKIPMTLDISHIYDDDKIMLIIENYWQNIPVLHLSARGEKENHLPIDLFCIQVFRKLVSFGWSGTITLEYLPWHHYRLRSDIEIIKQALIRDISPDEILPPCDAYKDCHDKWGYNASEPLE